MRTVMRMTKLGFTIGALMMTAGAMRRSYRRMRKMRDAMEWF